MFFDALQIKVRDEGIVRNKAVRIALGVRGDGAKEILGLWLEQNEDAKFWLRVMNELRNRGVEDMLLAVVDGVSVAKLADKLRDPATPMPVVARHALLQMVEQIDALTRRHRASRSRRLGQRQA